MRKGQLIVFEGIDGAGKATQVSMFAKKLRESGRTVSVFDFPRYKTPIGAVIRDYLNGKNKNIVSPYTVAAIYAIDRALAATEIRDALTKGIVVCNRYTPSNIAFQSERLRGSEAAACARFIETLEYKDLQIPRPDNILLIDVPVSSAQDHLRNKKKDRNELDVKFQKRVATRYRELAKARNWKKIDGRGSADQVHGRAWDALR